MTVSYRLISTAELDSGLLEAWRAVQRANAVFASPYFCPEFTLAVAAVRSDVRVVVLESSGRPVGFFPHQRGAWGKGVPVGGPLSDFHGVVALPGTEWSVPQLMHAARLSTWRFDHLVGDEGRLDAYRSRTEPSPRIDLSEGYDTYVRARRESGSDYIPKTEGLARKFEREIGALRFAFHQPGSGPLQRLIEWKRAQYRRAGTTDVFSVPWTGELLRHVALVQGPEFAGVCSSLRVGDRVVAAHLGMRSRASMHYWFPAYDPELAKFSLGIVLLLRILSAAADLKLRTFDLGKGESQYKQRLMSGAIEVGEGLATVPSVRATLAALHRKAESLPRGGTAAKVMDLPLRLIRRIERSRRLR